MDDIAGKKKKGKAKKKKSTVANSQKQKQMKGRVGNALRSLQRNLDRGHLKEVGPQRSAAESIIKISGAQKNETIVSVPAAPPAVVVVMGPRGVGKSTLIRSLVKLFTRQNLVNTTGPITVCCSSASKRRVTLIECPSDDLLSMVDLAKVADLALLLVDGSYGLQMETFEFLNLLQLHGFPKVAGVLTNLDCPRFQKNRTALQTVRKAVKQRLWTESHKGNKMFEFCGGLTGGKYKKNEVQRLALFVSRVKFRPLVWRNAHPYLLVDRIELLPQLGKKKENDASTRDVTLFGYVRGSRLRSGGSVHLAGAGDFALDFDAVTALPDPCPLASSSAQGGAFHKDTVREKKKNKSAALHAPMADSGRVAVDREGGLSIELRTVTYTKKEMLPLIHQAQINQESDRVVVSTGQPTPVDLLRSMQDVSHSLDQQLKGSKGNLQLFAGGGQNETDDSSDREDDDDDNDDDNDNTGDDSDDDGDGSQHSSNSNSASDESDHDNNDGPEVDGTEDEDSSDDDELESDDGKDNNWSDDDEEVDAEKDNTRSLANSAGTNPSTRADWMIEVYGKDWINKSSQKKNGKEVREDDGSDDDELGGLFKLAGKNRADSDKMDRLRRLNEIDSCRSFLSTDPTEATATAKSNVSVSKESDINQVLRQWATEVVSTPDEEDQEDDESFNDGGDKASPHSSSLLQLLKLRYVTGGWLQSTLTAPEEGTAVPKKSDKSRSGDADDDEDDEDEIEKLNLKIDADLRKENASRKAAFKASFDLKYDQGKMDSNGKKRKGGDGDEEEEEEEERDEAEVDSDDQSDDGKGGGRKKKGKGRRGDRGGGLTQQEIEEEEAMMKERAEAIKQQMAMVQERNKREFSEEGSSIRQQQLAGFGQGTYVRLLLRGVPAEFAEYFRPQTPLLLGGLLTHEAVPHSTKDTGVNGLDMGYLTTRVKRHRWHKRILKSNDPLIFSIGWRRFQAMPLYSIRDANQRQRFLKYTPEHMHCEASFCGPAVAPNTGIIAFQTISNSSSGFRIGLSGTVLEHRATCEVVKKLKLVGTPIKVFKNTAFITGMFSSALEVAKFEHAKIKTVSGIRGSIKRALTHDAPAGSFRASFEDKILMSDLVICRLWVPVTPPPLFNPVLSLLAPTSAARKAAEMKELPPIIEDEPEQPLIEEEESNSNERSLPLMRTTAQLRKDLKVPQVVAKDSVYKPIQRSQRVFAPLTVSAKLQAALPFASKPKQTAALNKQSYLQRRKVILEPEERKQRAVVQMLGAVKHQKVEKRVVANKKRLQSKKDTAERQAAKFEDVHKSEKKRKYTDIGKEQLARERKKAR